MVPPSDDLRDILRQIDEADKRALDLSSGLTDEQFHWQPNGGRAWGIAECLEHLGVANRVYGEAIRTGLARARSRGWRGDQPIASSLFGRLFIASLDPPVARRFRAPSKIRPGSARSRTEIVQLYKESHDLVRMLIQESASIDVNRATFANPFLPLIRVRVGTAFRIIAAHDRRHLWQAERVKEAPGFPGRVNGEFTTEERS